MNWYWSKSDVMAKFAKNETVAALLCLFRNYWQYTAVFLVCVDFCLKIQQGVDYSIDYWADYLLESTPWNSISKWTRKNVTILYTVKIKVLLCISNLDQKAFSGWKIEFTSGGRSKNLGEPLLMGCLILLLFSFLFQAKSGEAMAHPAPSLPTPL